MGRRPNPLIQLYFHRGAKLDDASNRYEQKCKRCHETFSKGRQETLINHITRKCQVITQEEKGRLLLDVSLHRHSLGGNSGSLARATSHPGLSGLDALAEVSRQHGHIDYAAQQSAIADEFLNSDHGGDENLSPVGPSPAQNGHVNWSIAPHSYAQGSSAYVQLLHHGYATSAPTTSTASLQMAEAALSALDPHLNHHEPRRTGEEHHQRGSLVDYSHGQPPKLDSSHSRHSMSLAQYVTNQQPSPEAEQPEAHSHSTYHSQNISQESENQRIFVDYTHGQQSPPTETTPDDTPASNGFQSHPSAELAPLITENAETTFAMWDAVNPPSSPMAARKVRGKFAAERRIAVKEVRKKGACLRCRMLKKSCDSGDPCNECAKLEGARLWKGQCVRTRLSKIFEVFSSGLFMVLAHHAVEATKHSGPPERIAGRLEATYFPQSRLYMTFPCVETPSADKTGKFTLIDSNAEELGERLTFGGRPIQYASELLEKHKDTENGIFKVSKFMNTTLALAMEMKDRILVKKALQLWVLTCILALQPSNLHVCTNSNLPPVESIASHSCGVTIVAAADLIFLQLRRAIEKCADILFRIVMVELEKSLIQRKQSDNFETFIGTILLLRCVEQMCHLYKNLDTSTGATEQTATGAPNAEASPKDKTYESPYKSPPPGWPLDKPPHYFWQQGERFSDLMCSMLKLRKVPPKSTIKDGVLTAEIEPPLVREWFQAIQLKPDDLREARAKPFESDDETKWEFRWMGKAFMTFES